MSTNDQAKTNKRALILTGLIVAATAVIMVLWLDDGGYTPDAETQRLMAEIGAQHYDQPLADRQLQWRLEADGGMGAMRLAELPEDTLVFLNLWATWCKPCVDEMPSMLALSEHLAGRPFLMIAVSYDESWEEIEVFFERLSGKMPTKDELWVLRDPEVGHGKPLRETFGTLKLPETYIIYNGRVLTRFINLRDWTDPKIIRYFEQLTPQR